MIKLHVFAICLCIAASAFMVAWPLWAIDRTLAEIEARMNRRIHRRNVKEICDLYGILPEAFADHLGEVSERLEAIRGSRIAEDEALPLLIAAIQVSRIQGVSISGAIRDVMECQR